MKPGKKWLSIQALASGFTFAVGGITAAAVLRVASNIAVVSCSVYVGTSNACRMLGKVASVLGW